MAYIGNISTFDSSHETWTSYQERLEQYFVVNKIDDDRKVAGLLTLIGEKAYGLLRNLTAPDKPSQKTFDELTALLKTHLCPKPLTIAERFRFHKRNQGTGENVQDYVASLRRLSEFCDFGTNLDDTLRDRFVCGLKDEPIQRKLLSMADLTLKKSIEIAVAMEAATKDAAELQSSAASGNVHRIKEKRRQKQKPREPDSSMRTSYRPCIHCGKTNHESSKCRFIDAICHNCQKKGHIRKVCLKAKTVKSIDDSDVYFVYTIKGDNKRKITVTPEINGVSVPMELDTGSSVTLMSESDFRKRFGNVKLRTPDSVLKTYSGEVIEQEGTLTVTVKCNNQTRTLKMCIVKGDGPALMGRDWLREIRLNWDSIFSVNADSTQVRLTTMLKKYDSVFNQGIGKVKDIQAKLVLKENATPKFLKARNVAYALRPKIDKELDLLEKQGIVTKVETSEWATPIVPIVKGNGDVRICGDFKVTVNPELNIDKYPLPKIEDIFANLGAGQRFSKLDLRQAFLQLECHESSKELLTINTHRGLYRYNRMLYGVASAPAIWQRTIDQVLQDIPGVQCILDDMGVTGESDDIHLDNLEKVLSRLDQYGIKVNIDKCKFFQTRITYCGHEIDGEGLWKCNDKVEAVLNTPPPHDVTSVRAYLGVLNYYHRFLPDLSTVIKPMTALLEKNRTFTWSKECQRAFDKSKVLLTSEPVLTHYNPELPVRLASDASPVGISGILSHVMPDGSEKPIAFSSRALTKTEQAYCQLDREALGIYYAVKKFYPYLYGHKFTLITDCQPLLSIFSPRKGITATTAARVQRYAMYLSGFDYDIVYKCTKKHTNVDGLSRLPAPCKANQLNQEPLEEVFYTSQLEQLPVTCAEISRETKRERVLSRVFENVKTGWSADSNDPILKGYYTRRNEMSIHRGCLLWGIRVIIPTKFRDKIMSALHVAHPGIVRMKSLARSYVWWPGIDTDLEIMVKHCNGCQMQQKSPEKVYVHPWEWPSSPWERIHIDFAGPFLGKMFLIVVDAHSKWPEVIEMQSITSESTIKALRSLFGKYGLVRVLVSDNGVQLTSGMFADFMKQNGILHIRTSVAKPSTNGLAERFIQTFKTAMRAMNYESDDLNLKMNSFLLQYRSTPHATTGETPAKMFLGRNVRTVLDLIKPDTKCHVTDSQMKVSFSNKNTCREMELGQSVLVRDYRPTSKNKWITGHIISRDGPLLYKIDIGNGNVWKRHIDQIRASELVSCSDNNTKMPEISLGNYDNEAITPVPVIQNADTVNNQKGVDLTPERRYPARVRKSPYRFVCQ